MNRLALAAALMLPTMALQAATERPARKAKPPVVGSGVIVTLVNGTEVKGIYRGKSDGAVWVEVEGGQTGIEPDTIAGMTAARTPSSEYNERAAALRKDDAPGWWKLSEWAAENELAASAQSAASAVLALAPEHAGARARLGYQKFGNAWLQGDALSRAQGKVFYEGRWLTRSEAVAAKAEEYRAAGIRQARAETNRRSSAAVEETGPSIRGRTDYYPRVKSCR